MMTDSTVADSTEKTEGWGIIRPGDRKAHYYRDMTSLCRRVGFYTGPLDADDKPSPDDCAACRKELLRETAKKAAQR
ncbi:MAG TPA: hypothetical protein VN714_19275 [Trebonia sp.]|nr:hypothetical protein [Trebonia sp.]